MHNHRFILFSTNAYMYPLAGNSFLEESREVEVIKHRHRKEHIDGHLQKVSQVLTVYSIQVREQ